eukprot:scaffold15413_cov34-Prasinocladus_malaysianus.AAC.1
MTRQLLLVDYTAASLGGNTVNQLTNFRAIHSAQATCAFLAGHHVFMTKCSAQSSDVGNRACVRQKKRAQMQTGAWLSKFPYEMVAGEAALVCQKLSEL